MNDILMWRYAEICYALNVLANEVLSRHFPPDEDLRRISYGIAFGEIRETLFQGQLTSYDNYVNRRRFVRHG